MSDHYDYIICGAGAAGLSLAYQLSDSAFDKYNILIIDKDNKTKNDRTWCSWTDGTGIFDHLAEKKWETVVFRNQTIDKEISLKPFSYIKIRGIDYYNYTLEKIQNAKHITLLQEEVINIIHKEDVVQVKTNHNSYSSKWVFSSLPNYQIDKKKHNYVDQHFKGWFIKTEDDAFEDNIATLMDFSIPQHGECRFMYVLPTSKRKALVELAIFSNNRLVESAYDDILKKYVEDNLEIGRYVIEEVEFASIPMTTYPFEDNNELHLTNIGILGGAVKASTGYAFQHIHEQTKYLVDKIGANQKPKFPKSYYHNRFRWYDKVLLNVLLESRTPLAEVFGDMFANLPAPLIFKFLSNKTTVLEELKILSKPKALPFIKAAINEFFKTN